METSLQVREVPWKLVQRRKNQVSAVELAWNKSSNRHLEGHHRNPSLALEEAQMQVLVECSSPQLIGVLMKNRLFHRLKHLVTKINRFQLVIDHRARTSQHLVDHQVQMSLRSVDLWVRTSQHLVDRQIKLSRQHLEQSQEVNQHLI